MGIVNRPAVLDGKWFIQRVAFPGGGLAVTRGRVIGQLSEIYPYYLVEVWPSDPARLNIRAETVLDLASMQGTYFYSDEALFEEEWRELNVVMEKGAKRAQAAERAAERKARQASRKGGGSVPSIVMQPMTLQEVEKLFRAASAELADADVTDATDEDEA